jgi:hypothetical protein
MSIFQDMPSFRISLSRLLAVTPLGYFPVRVRRGPAKGARWTAGPFSHNWRRGGEEDLAAGLALLPGMTGAVCWDLGAHAGILSFPMWRPPLSNVSRVLNDLIAELEPSPIFPCKPWCLSISVFMNRR